MGRQLDPEYVRALKGKKPRLSREEMIAWQKDLPLPPDWISAAALKCWDRMAAELQHAGILLAITQDKLARYCQAYADYAEIMVERNKLGPRKLKITDKNRDEMLNHLKMLKLCDGIMCDFEHQYGLTPSSATKVRRPIGAGGDTPREDMDKFLEEGKGT